MSILLLTEPVPEVVVEYWPITAIIVVFDLVLRLLTMWKSARKGRLIWFLCLALLSTAGLLPLIYLVRYRTEKNG